MGFEDYLDKNNLNRGGIYYLKQKIDNYEKLTSVTERKAFLKFFVKYTYDIEHGTNYFYIHPSLISNKLALMEGEQQTQSICSQAKETMRSFWIHTKEEGMQAKYYVEFLHGGASMEIQSPDSEVISMPDGTKIYKVPLENNFIRTQLFTGTDIDPNKPFYQSELFFRDAAFKTVKLPSGEIFTGNHLDLSERPPETSAERLHKMLEPEVGSHIDIIEMSISQKCYELGLTLISKHFPEVNTQLPSIESLPILIRLRMPSIIEEDTDEVTKITKIYSRSINGVFSFYKSLEEDPEKIGFVETVIVCGQGKESFYFIDYGLHKPPENTSEFIQKKRDEFFTTFKQIEKNL